MLTDSQLQEAIERAEKATNGPWYCGYGDGFCKEDHRCITTDASRSREDDSSAKNVVDAYLDEFLDEYDGVHLPQDADFIAHARTDVPAFARELLRVRALARKLLDAGTLDDGEREVVEAMVGGEG